LRFFQPKRAATQQTHFQKKKARLKSFKFKLDPTQSDFFRKHM